MRGLDVGNVIAGGDVSVDEFTSKGIRTEIPRDIKCVYIKMTNSQKIHLLDQNGQAYTNLDESMRPYLKSLTPEQLEEDKNWWCTALEITGNQQSTFTIGQIVGNVISQVWDQIPALSRIKEWHKQAVDPSAACMEEANQVARYFMMVHPRQTFQYIDNNGGKKGKSARYKMVGAVTEITLGSDIDWDNHKHLAWRFGNTNFCGSCNNYKEFFKQICSFLTKLDTNTLIDFVEDETKKSGCFEKGFVHEWDNYVCACLSSSPKDNQVSIEDYCEDDTIESKEKFALLVNPYSINEELEADENYYWYDPDTEVTVLPMDDKKELNGLYLYLVKNISNEAIAILIRKLFNIYGLSYDDLKIQFI